MATHSTSQSTGIDIVCAHCGETDGHVDLSGSTVQIRCSQCGRFGKRITDTTREHPPHGNPAPTPDRFEPY